MSAPLISLLHPTRRVSPSEGFPRGFRAVMDWFLKRTDNPARVEYVVSVHESRWMELQDIPATEGFMLIGLASQDSIRIEGVFGLHAIVFVKNSDRDNCVDNLNNAAEHATGQLFVSVADDLYPPEHWDTLILESLDACDYSISRINPHSELVMVFSSGASPERDRELMIAGAMTRKRYERYGFMLDPDFESMFSDNWYGFCARRDAAAGLCQIIERLDIQFEHRHPIFGKGQMDAAYEQQNREEAYKLGELTFIQKTTGKPIVLVMLPGETFRSNWVRNTLNMLFGMGCDCLPVPSWNYSSNVYATRMEMAEWALNFRPRAEFVLWKDDDQEATVEQVNMLARDLKEHPELDVVVGFSWCDNHDEKSNRLDEWSISCGRQRWSDLQCNRFRGDDIMKALRGNGLITSDDLAPHAFWSGFPLVLMRMSVLEKLGPQAFRARTTDPELLACLKLMKEKTPLFPTMVHHIARIDAAIERAQVIAGTKFGQTSEDTSFFMACHEKGIKCAVDVRVEVPHIKPRAIRPQFIPASKVESMNLDATESKFGPLNMRGKEESELTVGVIAGME